MKEIFHTSVGDVAGTSLMCKHACGRIRKMKKNKKCILIADDEIKMIRALKDYFTAKDFFVLEAFNGAEALDWVYILLGQ